MSIIFRLLRRVSELSRTRPWTTTLSLLAFVGLIYLGLQLILVNTNRYLSYDEAIYYSQVAPRVLPQRLTGSRSRGIAWLIAPLVTFTDNISIIRIGIILIHLSLLIMAYAAWTPVIGSLSAIAAALFAYNWLSIFYGSEIVPNLSTALLCVAGVGLATRPLIQLPAKPILVATVFACTALMRISDAFWLCIGFGIGVLIVSPKRIFKVCLPVGVGSLVGGVPWVAEAYARFGGLANRLREASAKAGGLGSSKVFLWHLSINDAYHYDENSFGGIRWDSVAWWLSMAVLVFIGVYYSRKKPSFGPLIVSVVASTVIFTSYVYFAGIARARFLLPNYALFSLSSSVGISFLLSAANGNKKYILALLILSALIFEMIWHVKAVQRINKRQTGITNVYRNDGDEVMKEAKGHPCAVARWQGTAPIAVRSGCEGIDFWSKKRAAEVHSILKEKACSGDYIFVIGHRSLLKNTPFLRWKEKNLSFQKLFSPINNGRSYCEER